MPRHSKSHICKYTPEELFALVIDIESYPKFLPWCKGARIIKRNNEHIIAELMIEFAGLSHTYTSRVTFSHPHSITVDAIEGPFHYLTNIWKFDPINENETLLSFVIDFKFRSKVLDTMIGVVFDKTVKKLTQAFLERAKILYADKTQN
jgi:coenzyme Q-binding protein COQ10